jgi:hypothetical protein
MNERSNGNGNGRNSGDRGDPVDAFAASDDETVVAASEEYVLGFLAKFPGGLRRLADRFDEHRSDVRKAGIAAVLDGLREEVREAELILAGAGRGMDRIILSRKKKGKRP